MNGFFILTRNSSSCILHSGMKSKLNILAALLRKGVCIAFMLLISVNFSVGSSLSNTCKGGPDCANCADSAHSHMPGATAQMENTNCRPGDKNTTCGFEAGRTPDDANRIALTVRSDPYEFPGIFVVRSEVHTRPNSSGDFPLQFDSPDTNGAIPIFLLNDSLLC